MLITYWRTKELVSDLSIIRTQQTSTDRLGFVSSQQRARRQVSNFVVRYVGVGPLFLSQSSCLEEGGREETADHSKGSGQRHKNEMMVGGGQDEIFAGTHITSIPIQKSLEQSILPRTHAYLIPTSVGIDYSFGRVDDASC